MGKPSGGVIAAMLRFVTFCYVLAILILISASVDFNLFNSSCCGVASATERAEYVTKARVRTTVRLDADARSSQSELEARNPSCKIDSPTSMRR
jgi:glycyl-tRNA synthetase alpha subunit